MIQIWRLWNRVFDGFAKHANVAFDLHLYHCSLVADRLSLCSILLPAKLGFGAWWQRQGLGSHLRLLE